MINSLSDVEIISGYRTDHNAITMSIQTRKQRGSGLWKFNTAHLAGKTYLTTVRDCITQTVRQYVVPLYSETVYNDYKYYESVALTISDRIVSTTSGTGDT